MQKLNLFPATYNSPKQHVAHPHFSKEKLSPPKAFELSQA